MINCEAIFVQKGFVLDAKLKILLRNTRHQHILLSLDGGVIEDRHDIYSMDSAELSTEQQDPELRALVEQFNVHPSRHTVVVALEVCNVALAMAKTKLYIRWQLMIRAIESSIEEDPMKVLRLCLITFI